VHDRVGKTGTLYYSCTDMRDTQTGESLDLDFDVKAENGKLWLSTSAFIRSTANRATPMMSMTIASRCVQRAARQHQDKNGPTSWGVVY
jgi:hypothetical protein